VAKKGVGYAGSRGPVWDVKDYISKKEAKNNQITSIINIFKNSIKCLDNKSRNISDQDETE